MLTSLLTRAARASVAGSLFCSLSLAPALAHMASLPMARAAHPTIGGGHSLLFGARGFNHFHLERFGFDHFGFNRFGPNRFDRFGFGRFNRFGFNRFGRNGNAWNGNQLGVTGWGDWGGAFSAPAAPTAPIIIGGGGPPVVISVNAGPSASDVSGGYRGSCVIHLLNFDGSGKYVGEKQYPEC